MKPAGACPIGASQSQQRQRGSGGASSCYPFSSPSGGVGFSKPRRVRRALTGASGPLGIGMGDCPSEDECEIVYDDDDDDSENNENDEGDPQSYDNDMIAYRLQYLP